MILKKKFSDVADASASATAIINAVADDNSVVEIKAGYAENVVTAFAQMGGSTVGFIAFDGNAVCPNCAYKAEALSSFAMLLIFQSLPLFMLRA